MYSMFKDRKDAGQQLGRALKKYQNKNPLVLAIPRGGVEIGFQVAKALKADLDLLIARKLPYPGNPEAGFGAVAEDGSVYLVPQVKGLLSSHQIEKIISQQKKEAERRVRVLRKNRPLPDMKGRTVILVDDGIAVGVTMKASIKLVQQRNSAEIIVGSPVSGPEKPEEFAPLVDEIIVLEQPPNFRAVAQIYQNWHDVKDKEVLEIMEKWRKLT